MKRETRSLCVPTVFAVVTLAIPLLAHGQAAMVTVFKLGASAVSGTLQSTLVSGASSALADERHVGVERHDSNAGQSAGVGSARFVQGRSVPAAAVCAQRCEETAAVADTRRAAAPHQTEQDAATLRSSTSVARCAASQSSAAASSGINGAPSEVDAAARWAHPARYSAFSLASRNAVWDAIANEHGASRQRSTGASSEMARSSGRSSAAVSSQNEAARHLRNTMNPPGRRP
jgi:hypothetical protein